MTQYVIYTRCKSTGVYHYIEYISEHEIFCCSYKDATRFKLKGRAKQVCKLLPNVECFILEDIRNEKGY